MQVIKEEYSYAEVVSWLNKKGAELFGADFKLYDDDQYVIYKLIAYFLRDEQACKLYGLNLSKGILLTGPIGCGKTTLMTIMKLLSLTAQKFQLRSCREVNFEFIRDGFETIHRYSRGRNPSDIRIICFDDLGIEKNVKYYGNECNVMAEILLSRYDLFVSKHVPTHITTNLSASEIEIHYGNRVRSRLRQMVNLIAFNESTPDKRQ